MLDLFRAAHDLVRAHGDPRTNCAGTACDQARLGFYRCRPEWARLAASTDRHLDLFSQRNRIP